MYMQQSEPHTLMDARFKCLMLLSPFAVWQVSTPDVTLHYSENATSELSYIWNTHHRTFKRRLLSGETTGDYGAIFQDEDFFMEVYWRDSGNISGCVRIDPKWPETHIYLKADGRVDTSPAGGTDVDRLYPCLGSDV